MRGSAAACAIALLAITGCVGTVSGPAEPTTSASPATASDPNALPTVTPASLPPTASAALVSPAPSPSGPSDPADVTPAPSAPNAAFRVPSLVATVEPDVRVRSAPGLGTSSEKFTPLLPSGTQLVVLNGPVAADGYDWYEVTELDPESSLPSGWVAAGSRTGEGWLAARTPACPGRPTTVTALAAMSRALALVCFPRVPITVKAHIERPSCEVDGPGIYPGWFLGDCAYLVDPSDPTGDASIWLTIDPAAKVPPTLPVDQVVTVTGILDHPAADACLIPSWDGYPASVTGTCRLQFAVTEIEP
jgi:hypothetical protein